MFIPENSAAHLLPVPAPPLPTLATPQPHPYTCPHMHRPIHHKPTMKTNALE